MTTSNLTDLLNGEDKPTIEAITAVKHYLKTEIDTSFKRSFVDLLEVSSWSFVTTTITLNVLAGHGIIATDTIWLDGLVSTTNAPNGEWTISSVTATTIVFTATLTPTGTETVLNAIAYKTTYVDADAVGANPVAKKYHDGSIVGSTDNGGYIKYANGELLLYDMKATGQDVNVVTGALFSSTAVSLPTPTTHIGIDFAACGDAGSTSIFGAANQIRAANADISAKLYSYVSFTGRTVVANAKGRWR